MILIYLFHFAKFFLINSVKIHTLMNVYVNGLQLNDINNENRLCQNSLLLCRFSSMNGMNKRSSKTHTFTGSEHILIFLSFLLTYTDYISDICQTKIQIFNSSEYFSHTKTFFSLVCVKIA